MSKLRHLLMGAACALVLTGTAPAFAATPEPAAVVRQYADIALAMYSDSFETAKRLDDAIAALLAAPSEQTLAAARTAWKAARVPYQQTEGFRFGNAAVDEWEGKVNAWPLDEGLIDYVDTGSYGESSDENPLYRANVIAAKSIRIGKDQIDVTEITPTLLAGTLQEAQGIEANVATGYHAIEFLLWGQDLNGTGPGAGNRQATDFSLDNCTNDHCERRRTYLKVLSNLLLSDLSEMVDAWGPEGAARKDLLAKSPEDGLATILTGLGSLSYGELAGERMKLGLILHDPEEEHDCFSDNTHNSHYYDQVGMVAIYQGRYARTDGGVVEGPSLAEYAAAKAPAEAAKVEAAMEVATRNLAAIKQRADDGVEAYDQMIGEGNDAGNAVVQAGVDGLVAQARAIEALVEKLDLNITVEGSDSLDNPAAVE